MIKPPCKDCPNRYPGCHDTCPDWQTYKQQRECVYKERLVQADATAAQWDMSSAARKIFESKLRRTHNKYRKV